MQLKYIFAILLSMGLFFAKQTKAESELDSLESILPFANDVQRADLLNGIALLVRNSDSTKAGNYTKQALALSSEIDFCKGSASANVIIGLLYLDRGQFLLAKQYCLKGLSAGLTCKEPYSVALAYNALGDLSYIKKDYLKSLRFYFSALKLSKQLNDYRRIANTLKNIGAIYVELKDAEKSESFLIQALDLYKQLKDQNNQAIIANHLADAYRLQGYDLKALYHYLLALEIYRESGSAYDVAAVLNNIGTVFLNRNQYKKALPYLQESQLIDATMNDKKSLVKVLGSLSKVYYFIEKKDSAMDLATRAVLIADNFNLPAEKLTAVEILSKLYAEAGDQTRASKYENEYRILNSRQAQEAEQTKELNTTVEEAVTPENALMEDQVLATDSEENPYQILSIGLGFALVLLTILFVLFKRNFSFMKSTKPAKTAVNADFYRELKSSIHVLKGMSQLAMESKNMDSLKENLSAVKLATDELVFLVDNLHTIQEIESDTLRINKEKFSLISYLENLFVLTNAKAKVKQSNFRQMVYEGVPDWVQFDKTKLSLILLNLLNNAIRFSNGNDIEVEVKLIARRKLGKQNCSKIEIEISNEGSGISKELLALIQQEKFEKISGNGLYIVNELTKKLGGQFKINSIKSQGVMVKLQFEFEETDEQNIGFSNKNLKKLNKHILLADDNVMNQKFLEKVLQDAGYQCDCVSNGAEVLEALTQKSYNMLLLDVHMPVLDGIATCKRIKSEKYFNRHSQMPIVGLTANAQLRMKKKCQDVGMNDVLNKPFNKEQLLQIVNDLI